MGEKSTGSVVKFITDMANLITDHGVFKIIEAIAIIALAISVFTIAAKPEIILEQLREISRNEEIENRNFRKVNDPLIRQELHELIYETGGSRASVLEFHNGKENPSSLGFYYADMTYEVDKDNMKVINFQYQNVNLSLLNMSTILYENGYWYGSVEELSKIDPTLSQMISGNGTNWIALILLERGNLELGILELSFEEEPQDLQYIGKEIRRTGVSVASMLDFEGREKK